MAKTRKKMPSKPKPRKKLKLPGGSSRKKSPGSTGVKSRRQVSFLLSEGSPLSSRQQTKLKQELKSGKVRIKKK